MLTEVCRHLRRYDMIAPGDTVTCAVSGGADSMALLWAMYLLRDKLGIHLGAAHFNHHLRGPESDRDEAFVRDFCDRFDIPLTVGQGNIIPGEKGLEAAARDARYAFLEGLSGKIATAHTADDNAETVLMHLIRGTGLKGLGGIAPVNGKRIRPMLTVTRRQVEHFLEDYHISHVEDSSNGADEFLRNRIRHHVMPLLTAENPRLPENLSAMAQRLRLDDAALEQAADFAVLPDVPSLKKLPQAVRSRALEHFLKENGIKEPEAAHIFLVEGLIFSSNPSASADLPGGVMVRRDYDCLTVAEKEEPLETVALPRQGTVQISGLRITVSAAEDIENSKTVFTVSPVGDMVLRHRLPGDSLRLPAGTKSLKKLFIDRKIPAAQRLGIPVLADEAGVLGVYNIGVNLDRAAESLPALQVRFEMI